MHRIELTDAEAKLASACIDVSMHMRCFDTVEGEAESETQPRFDAEAAAWLAQTNVEGNTLTVVDPTSQAARDMMVQLHEIETTESGGHYATDDVSSLAAKLRDIGVETPSQSA